jgi:predicted MPP superfamily phosphohydrolase
VKGPEKETQHRNGISRRKFLLGGGAAFGGVVLGDAFYREPRSLEVKEVVLPLKKVPSGREIRLVHLSDLHIRDLTPYYDTVARAVNSLDPAAILLTGDYLEGEKKIGEVQSFLESLHAPQGKFAVQGNWEFWARMEGKKLQRQFRRSTTELLLNQRRDVELEGTPLSVLGLDYPSTGDALEKVQALADPERINILLSHVPAFAHQRLDSRVDLILCGHTHGGQVRLPLAPPFYLPRFSGRFVQGLYRVGPAHTPLYVTRGIGTSVIPIRLFCRPEITLLRLTSG